MSETERLTRYAVMVVTDGRHDGIFLCFFFSHQRLRSISSIPIMPLSVNLATHRYLIRIGYEWPVLMPLMCEVTITRLRDNFISGLPAGRAGSG